MYTRIGTWFVVIAFTLSFLTVARTPAEERKEERKRTITTSSLTLRPSAGPTAPIPSPIRGREQRRNSRGKRQYLDSRSHKLLQRLSLLRIHLAGRRIS